MTQGWRGRFGHSLRIGIGAVLLIGPIGCFSADKPKKEGSRALPLPSNLPPPNLPLPSANPNAPSITPPAAQPSLPSSINGTPSPVSLNTPTRSPIAETASQQPNLSGGTIHAATLPGASSAMMPLSPPPGASAPASRSVAVSSILPPPNGEASPPPLQGTQPGLKQLIPAGDLQPPASPIASIPTSSVVPPSSTVIESSPPLPSGGTPEIVSSTVPVIGSSKPSGTATNGMLVPPSLGPVK